MSCPHAESAEENDVPARPAPTIEIFIMLLSVPVPGGYRSC